MQRRTWGVLIIGIVLSLTGCVAGGSLVLILLERDVFGEEAHVAEVPVYGQIVMRGQGGLLTGSVASAEDIVEQLDRARENPDAKAVLLRVDSPGGSVNASREIWLAVKRVQEAGKPVVVIFEETAASGGYYISAPADYILAMPDTITGSIGVIALIPNLAELYDKLGIDYAVIKSGPYKDMLSPNRPLTEDERRLVEQIIAEAYQEFVSVVAEGRELPEDEVRRLADGRIYTGRQAEELGLVDGLGSYRDAVAKAGELAGLGPEPKVIEYRRAPTFFEQLAGAVAARLGLESLPTPWASPTHFQLRYSLGG